MIRVALMDSLIELYCLTDNKPMLSLTKFNLLQSA
jgi:hypothetical protein